MMASLRSSQFIISAVGFIMTCYFIQSSADPAHTMMHNHLSRKVLERACAASKDTIDEIVACYQNNKVVSSTLKPEIAQNCHKEAFGQPFDPNDLARHKDEVCKHKDKFEDMTACIYRETTKTTSPKEIEKLSEALVDMGLCIINALDS